MGKALAVDLISPDEKIAVEVGASTFYVRRLLPEERESLLNQATQKGVVNYGQAARLFCLNSVVGWDNVNMNGKPTEFNKDLVKHFPEKVYLAIAERLNIVSYDENDEETEKN